jgi:hypothetical protein
MSVEGKREGGISPYVSNPRKDTQTRLVDLLSNNSKKGLIENCLNGGVHPKILWQSCGTNLDKSVSAVYSYL